MTIWRDASLRVFSAWRAGHWRRLRRSSFVLRKPFSAYAAESTPDARPLGQAGAYRNVGRVALAGGAFGEFAIARVGR